MCHETMDIKMAGRAGWLSKMCALAQVIKPSGMVVSMRSVEKIIKKDMLDPFTAPPTTVKEKDIIPLRVEGMPDCRRGLP